MTNTLTIDLDFLDREKVQRIAGMILTYVDADYFKKPDESGLAQQNEEPEPTFNPIEAFGNSILPVTLNSIISPVGPSLVVPNVTAEPTQTPNADSSGIPWDSRIHASTRALNGDGTWRIKRGVDKALVDQVMIELKKLMALPIPITIVTPEPAAPVAPPPPPANDADFRQKYIELFGRVSSAMANAKLSQDQLDKCLLSIGVQSLPLLAARMDLGPAAANLIDALIAGNNA